MQGVNSFISWFVACMLWTNMNDYIPPVQSSPPPSKGIPKTMWWWNRCQITLLSKSDISGKALQNFDQSICSLNQQDMLQTPSKSCWDYWSKKEEADKEVGWPDPNPGATQLDLPTGICPHAPLHSSYPPSPSRYARMLRQPHECHFKLHTSASLMDSRTTQAGGMCGKQQQRSFCRNENFSQ